MEQFVNVILASGSPRRKELFEQAGIKFNIIISDAEEKITNKKPEEAVKELAFQKAAAVKNKFLEKNFSGPDLTYKRPGREPEEKSEGKENEDICEGTLIVGADTIVISGGKILGKPKDEKDALSMLMSLSGKDHFVYTGVSGIYLDKKGKVIEEKSFCFSEETVVTMYSFMEEEAKAYIRTGEPMDKAGSYGIQGAGALFVKAIRGDYNNVVGFPLGAFFRLGCQKNFFRL